jgi:glycerol-3-phosphate dehydrogenase
MPDRARALTELSTRTFDALIIGGGITGCGIARDAALRGLTVALIDKGDFASGTSSRSSRLIHGGVRYLEHGHLHLVFEASAERRRLLQLAPRLVHPLAFTWPVYAGQRLGRWKLSAGLTLYDMLSLFRNVARHRRLTSSGVSREEPGLSRKGLRGGVRYFDAATNDARLTLANALDARALGAVLANHLVLTSSARAGDTHVARVEDTLEGSRLEIRARVLVNAAGPWTDDVREREGAARWERVQGSKGAHIAVPRERVGNRDAITMLHPRDQRVMFVLPAGGFTIIGTTDTFTHVSPDEVRATREDVDYLLEAANFVFPDAALARDDVISAWAGIRPLMPSGGSEGQASREHAIDVGDHTVTITGGKLTTYRVMARQVVDAVERALGRAHRRTATDTRPLPDGAPGVADAPSVTASGTLTAGVPTTRGDVERAVTHEMACTLGDILIRRTHVAFETRDHGRGVARDVLPIVAPLLGWDASRSGRELARYDAEVARTITIDGD